MKAIFLLLLFLLNLIFISSSEVECEGTIIEHCSKCSTGDDSDACATCDDYYFPFFSDLYCLPCNDSIYGQTACEKKCNGTNYITTRFPFCEKEGCAEGYFNLNGICTNCSTGSPNCKDCTYEVSEQETNGNFICHECESNEYLLTSYGECKHCNTFLSNCQECHYEKNSKEVCDKCYGGYFPNSEGKCQNCYYRDISGGRCYVCSVNETEYDHCYCYGGYVKIGHSECHDCGSGCSSCLYDNKTGSTECLRCYSGYVFNSDKKCIYCGDRCNKCKLDKNNNPICLSCNSNAVLKDDKCLFCDYGCSNCTIDPKSAYKNETICSSCRYDYAFNPENNNCTDCEYIQQLGGENGCERCLYNEKSKDYECLECRNENYTYINNTYQCLRNIDSSRLYLYGCLKAQYIEKSGTYECFECKNDFIHITNDRTCRKLEEINLSEGCLEVVNLGTVEEPLYSCEQCLNNYTKVIINSNTNQKNCYKREDNFWYCLEGLVEENGEHKCTKCDELASLNSSNLCQCNCRKRM